MGRSTAATSATPAVRLSRSATCCFLAFSCATYCRLCRLQPPQGPKCCSAAWEGRQQRWGQPAAIQKHGAPQRAPEHGTLCWYACMQVHAGCCQ